MAETTIEVKVADLPAVRRLLRKASDEVEKSQFLIGYLRAALTNVIEADPKSAQAVLARSALNEADAMARHLRGGHDASRRHH